MFSNLIESSTAVTNENARKNLYFAITAVLNGGVFLAIFVWSIYSFNVSAIGQNEDLAINTLVAPIALPEAAPPPAPEIIRPASAADQQNQSASIDRLRDPVADINTVTEPPKNILSRPSTATPVRPGVPFVKSSVNSYAADSGEIAPERGNSKTPTIAVKQPPQAIENDTEPPPPLKAKIETAAAPKKITTISKGVINGTATNLPKPIYPPAAKQVRASGAVHVQVLIDEKGSVVSAAAVSGHALLRAAAVQAAKSAKFTPTQLSNQPVKVTGVIVYNFVAQ